MYHPTNIAKLSAAQISKILNGHRVRVKHGNHHVLHLSHEQAKKVHSSHKKGCACTIQFDPFQQQMEHHHSLRKGKGVFDVFKSVVKAVAPVAIDEGGKCNPSASKPL